MIRAGNSNDWRGNRHYRPVLRSRLITVINKMVGNDDGDVEQRNERKGKAGIASRLS
jgi:hypothetical protein